jgi:penicillin-insensitive murein endopeptidase
VATLWSAPREARAAPSRTTASLLVPQKSPGQSIGSPTDGRLVGGSHLDETPYIRVLPAYASNDARWGLGSLVALIERSARAVRQKFPDAVLSVGQLSRRGGGDIDRHASHESGRDADLSFYIRGQTNHALYSDHMVSFRGDGSAPTWPGAFFDDAKNWALVAAISQESHARVTYIFVAAPLRARLLAYAAHIGASQAIRNKAAELMVQPRGSLPHDDHFHVRIGCPDGMTGCIELPTRPKAARNAVASRGRAAHRDRAPVVASVKAPSPTKTPSVTPPASVPPTSPASGSPEDDASPRVLSAVLLSPFDDVDGPPASTDSPDHGEIR